MGCGRIKPWSKPGQTALVRAIGNATTIGLIVSPGLIGHNTRRLMAKPLLSNRSFADCGQ
jgi:hypothetical protein